MFQQSGDLHGFSLEKANHVTKDFVIKSYNEGYRKLIIVTGKGLRSKKHEDPYVSSTDNILKNSCSITYVNGKKLRVVVSRICVYHCIFF